MNESSRSCRICCWVALIVVALLVGYFAAFADRRMSSMAYGSFCNFMNCDFLSQFISFLRDAALRFIPWPFVVMAIFFSLGADRVSIFMRQIVRRVKRVKFAGNEMELSVENKAEIEMDSRRFKSEVQSYRDIVLIEMSRLVNYFDIQGKIGKIIPNEEDAKCPVCLTKNWRKDLRITIHVSDFVFADRLVQLVDYVGNGSRGTAGRTFSMRQGIIGKVWRGRKAILKNDLLAEAKDEDPIPHQLIVKIVQDWGMMEEEAYKAAEYRSYFAMPIFERLKPDAESKGVDPKLLGILYLDSKSKDQFKLKKGGQAEGQTEEQIEEQTALQLANWLNGRLDVVQLPNVINDIIRNMERFHPGITLAV